MPSPAGVCFLAPIPVLYNGESDYASAQTGAVVARNLLLAKGKAALCIYGRESRTSLVQGAET